MNRLREGRPIYGHEIKPGQLLTMPDKYREFKGAYVFQVDEDGEFSVKVHYINENGQVGAMKCYRDSMFWFGIIEQL